MNFFCNIICFHYWDYFTNFWRNNWQSIFDVVERLCYYKFVFLLWTSLHDHKFIFLIWISWAEHLPIFLRNKLVFEFAWTTLCRSNDYWIGMKVLGTDSIILGIRKLWWMFPIKQKYHTTAAFLDNLNFWIKSSLNVFLPLCNWTIKTIVWF